VQNADGTYAQTTTVDQQDLVREASGTDGFEVHVENSSNEVHATDTLRYDANFNPLRNTGSKTVQAYERKNTRGECYSRTLTAAAQKLVSVEDGVSCR